MLDWNVAIYCMNEAPRLRRCLDSVRRALGDRRALVTVIFNGTTDDGIQIAEEAGRAGMAMEIWRIPSADKSNAINQFFYHLRKPARLYGAVDGYTEIGADAFGALERRLDASPHALAMSGSSTTGRSMQRFTRQTLAEGGRLHGQFHALRPDFVDRFVARGIRLPIGLYWGDGLLCSMCAHDLDALGQPWDNMRAQGAAEATYTLPVLSMFRPSDIRRQFRRQIRQMRGRIQNAAIKQIVYRGNYEALPEDADDMAREHVAQYGAPPAAMADRAFQWLALRELRRPKPDQRPNFTPRLVNAYPAGAAS